MNEEAIETQESTQQPSSSPSSESATLEDNQFRVLDVPRDRGLLVADVVTVFSVDGKLCATGARCTHMGGPLQEGTLDGHVLTCPWHGAQFDVRTGEVLRGPATRPLDVYPVLVTGEIGELDAG